MTSYHDIYKSNNSIIWILLTYMHYHYANPFSKKCQGSKSKRFYDLKMEMEIISENIKLSKVNLKADQTRFRFSYVIT